jgi:hypothetical protein
MPDMNELELARMCLQGHMLNHAEILLLRLLAREPEHPATLHLLAITRFKLGRQEEAIALMRRVAEGQGVAAFWFDLAVALRDSGRRAESETAHREGLAALAAGTQGNAAPALDAQAFSIESGEHAFKLAGDDYRAQPRYGGGRPPHPGLARIIGAGHARYAALIDASAQLQADFAALPIEGDDAATVPYWLNTWFPPLDAMMLQIMLATRRPKLLVEVGSGMSTKFARQAIERHRLGTRIVSIDPQPRAAIDSLVDDKLRLPLEQVEPEWFDRLGEDDILFVDSSHRALQNSDVTMLFLDMLPRLRPGVVVHLHDIYLPYDYAPAYLKLLWNEQYFLAAALLYGATGIEILFPCWYASRDPELSRRLNQCLRHGPLADLSIHGKSFWLRKSPPKV